MGGKGIERWNMEASIVLLFKQFCQRLYNQVHLYPAVAQSLSTRDSQVKLESETSDM